MDEIITVSGVNKSFKSYESKLGTGVFLASLRRRSYIKKVLDDINFTITRGEAVALLGRNGSGKSTLIKILTGIITPDSGKVRVLGMDPFKDRLRLSLKMGVVFGKQDPLYWNLPAIDSLDFVKRVYKIPDKVYRERLNYLLDMLSLQDVYKRQVRTLSLGERMKCSFVSSVLHLPEVVFLDEPTIGVDLPSGVALRKAIIEMRRTYGTTFILTTHIIEDVEAMSERVVMLDQGVKVFDGSKDGLKNIFGDKKQLKLYLAPNAKIPLAKYGKVLDRKANYVKLEIESKALRTKRISDLLNSKQVMDYNVSEPGLTMVLEKLYKKRDLNKKKIVER